MADQQVHHPLFARLWERVIAPASVKMSCDGGRVPAKFSERPGR